jgi:hypothetical protein
MAAGRNLAMVKIETSFACMDFHEGEAPSILGILQGKTVPHLPFDFEIVTVVKLCFDLEDLGKRFDILAEVRGPEGQVISVARGVASAASLSSLHEQMMAFRHRFLVTESGPHRVSYVVNGEPSQAFQRLNVVLTPQ